MWLVRGSNTKINHSNKETHFCPTVKKKWKNATDVNSAQQHTCGHKGGQESSGNIGFFFTLLAAVWG